MRTLVALVLGAATIIPFLSLEGCGPSTGNSIGDSGVPAACTTESGMCLPLGCIPGNSGGQAIRCTPGCSYFTGERLPERCSFVCAPDGTLRANQSAASQCGSYLVPGSPCADGLEYYIYASDGANDGCDRHMCIGGHLVAAIRPDGTICPR